jgi:GxxExxY protein
MPHDTRRRVAAVLDPRATIAKSRRSENAKGDAIAGHKFERPQPVECEQKIEKGTANPSFAFSPFRGFAISQTTAWVTAAGKMVKLRPFTINAAGITQATIAKWRRSENAKGNPIVRHKFEQLSNRVIETAIAVHRELGLGFLESIYENALKTALRHRGIAYESQKEVTVIFEGEEAGVHRLDLLVENEIVVELKAVKALEDLHFAQLRSYLKATGLHVGLLMNFNAPTLIVKRVVLNYKPAECEAEE